MSAPVVGICAALERVRWGVWDQVVTMAPRSYARAVQAANAIAVLLAPDPLAQDDAQPFLDRVDAILLMGGSDLDPATYGVAPGAHTSDPWPERDQFELAICHAALRRDIPVLGICRGMQLLNVALGGTLVQHLPEVVDSDRHRHTPGTFGDHEVRLEPGSLAARAVGAERTVVKSHHHQGVEQVGQGLRVTGWSIPDDVVEAIELEGPRFALGVLWHPEEDERSRVVGALVEAARAGRGADRAPPGREAEEVARL